MDTSRRQGGLPIPAGTQAIRRTDGTGTIFGGRGSGSLPTRGRYRLGKRARTATVCLLVVLCLMAAVIPVFRQAGTSGGHGWLSALCRLMSSAGLPPAGQSASGVGQTEAPDGTTETQTAAEITRAEPDRNAGSATEPLPETDPAVTDEDETEPSTLPPDTSVWTEEPTGAPETSCYPENAPGIAYRDMSESERGAHYVWNDTDRFISPPTGEWTYAGVESPTVLIVCSHPYESYRGGDAAGTVSDLATGLAEALRARGVRVVFVGSALSGLTPDSSVRESYTRTQALARYYCRLYGNITLVLDVRRSAETVGNERLATCGTVGGQSAAQARFIVDALRRGAQPDGSATDLALAIALRQALFSVSPTLARPVYLRASQGLIPTGLCGTEYADGYPSPCLLTLELGASGNTFSEAECLLGYVSAALAAVLPGI